MVQPLSGIFPTEQFPALLVGLAAPDDAAVYQLDSERAIISTTDFFPPVVDDPYAFGAIAAANALSDIYAMGGEPLFAINLAAFPDHIDLSVLSEILRGGAEKVREAGAVIAGGHTIADKEPKYGLAVTGVVHPERILRKSGALAGDKLILTKPLGTGVVTTALKRQQAAPEHVAAAISSMSRLNREASRLAQQHGAHAVTDITGYSLLGHAHEMAHLSAVDFVIRYDQLDWLPGALDYAVGEMFPGGMWRNHDYFSQWVLFEGTFTDWQRQLLFDPQTSGGLLIAAASTNVEALLAQLRAAGERAAIIGEVLSGTGRIIVRLSS